MGVVFVLFAFVTVFGAVFCYLQNLRKMKLNIPAPFVLPIIGHAHLIIGLNTEGALKINPLDKVFANSFRFFINCKDDQTYPSP
jgi:hypothetical protein